MFKRSLVSIIIAFLINFIPALVNAQTLPSLKQQIATISAYNSARAPDKIFLHTDKWNYNREDTLWFKSYVFDAATMAASKKSGLMYIEIADADNRVIVRNMVALGAGTGRGCIPLTDKRFTEGTYIIRAYTNWMRNFDERSIFSRQFIINDPDEDAWLVKSRFAMTPSDGAGTITADLSFVTSQGKRMFNEDIRTKVSSGGNTFYRTTAKTGADGAMNLAFDLPKKADLGHMNISLTKKGRRGNDINLSVPVIINRDEKIDVSFMPEGGSFLGGMVNNIAFKAIDEQGYGVDVEGSVYNSKAEIVANFKSGYKGMGAFFIDASPGETYTARVKYKGLLLNFTLPQVKASGVMLQVNSTRYKDSLMVYVKPTSDQQQAGESYYLLGSSRGTNCYGAVINTGNVAIGVKIAKKIFLSGPAHFTLLNTKNQPVADRMFFIDHNDGIRLSITPSKNNYNTRDSVSLSIKATDKDGQPVAGNFSLAVVDNALVQQDTTGVDNINVKLLLCDELKGNVETPGWYFSCGDERSKALALDNLLLTQGWTSYNWADVFKPLPKPEFEAESEFAVKGKITTTFNKPVAKSDIILVSAKNLIVTDTLTNEKGEFTFTDLYPTDTMTFNLHARNPKGKSTNVVVHVDEFRAPDFDLPEQRVIPWYVNIDTARLDAIRAGKLQNEERLTGIT